MKKTEPRPAPAPWHGQFAPIIRCGCGSTRVLVKSLVERHGAPPIGHYCHCADCNAERQFRVLA